MWHGMGTILCSLMLMLRMQLEGAQTPGSNIAVAAATVRGSNSFGMICSAYDLGWMDAANGLAVRLPQDMKLGAPLDSTAPEVCGNIHQHRWLCQAADACICGLHHAVAICPGAIHMNNALCLRRELT